MEGCVKGASVLSRRFVLLLVTMLALSVFAVASGEAGADDSSQRRKPSQAQSRKLPQRGPAAHSPYSLRGGVNDPGWQRDSTFFSGARTVTPWGMPAQAPNELELKSTVRGQGGPLSPEAGGLAPVWALDPNAPWRK